MYYQDRNCASLKITKVMVTPVENLVTYNNNLGAAVTNSYAVSASASRSTQPRPLCYKFTRFQHVTTA
jgi:hypothetical protein